jgi:putative FmdB family regulatory protein
MPIYEYLCDNCHKVFEEWTKHIDDTVTATCPECKGSAQRIVSNTSFVLKGGGWYVTDYGYR